MIATTTAVATLLVAAAGPLITAQPLAKAAEGWVQCYEPDESLKTCQSIAAYKQNGDGSWDNTAIVSISPTQPMTIETVTTVREENGAVCGYIRRADIMNGTLRLSGKPVPPGKALPLLRNFANGMAPMLDRKICTTYAESFSGMIATASFEGADFAVPEQRVIWVLPSHGYRVAPGGSL